MNTVCSSFVKQFWAKRQLIRKKIGWTPGTGAPRATPRPPDARLFQSDDACSSAPACSRATQGARSASAKLARSARLLFLASARLPIEKRPEASDSSSTDGEALPGNSDGRRGSSGGSRHPCEALPGQVTLLIRFTLLSHSRSLLQRLVVVNCARRQGAR